MSINIDQWRGRIGSFIQKIESIRGPFYRFQMGHLENHIATVKTEGKNASSFYTFWIPLSISK